MFFVTGWTHQIVREVYCTETFGHWSDTVHRQRRSTKTFCHWLDTADRQKGVHRRLVAG